MPQLKLPVPPDARTRCWLTVTLSVLSQDVCAQVRPADAAVPVAAPQAPVVAAPSPEALLRARLSGTFVPAPSVANQQAINGGVDRSVAPLFFLIQPLARNRIHAGNPLFSSIVITFLSGEIQVISPPVNARAREDGTLSSVRGLDNERNNLTHRLSQDALIQQCWNDSGRRVTRFVPSVDGARLTVHVEITAPQLSVPIRYTLQYVRRR